MNETLKVLESRRSYRKFKNDMLPEEDLNAIIRAGTFAPTGMNKQTPIIIAVKNKELRDKISEENRKIGGWDAGFDPFYGAPVILIVLADSPRKRRVPERFRKEIALRPRHHKRLRRYRPRCPGLCG